jgi:hypothetical protein
VRPEDICELSRRLKEEYDLYTFGYDPIRPDARELWIKRHAGDLLTREQALREITTEATRTRPGAA